MNPPHDLNAEKSVIGAVLVDNDRFDAVSEILTPEDFYSPSYQHAWKAIGALVAAHQQIDATTLGHALRPYADTIGKPEELIADCAAAVPAPSLAADYAGLVLRMAIQRRVASYGVELTQKFSTAPETWTSDYLDELIACAEYDLSEITQRMERKPEPSKATVMAEALYKLGHQLEQGIPLGLERVDPYFVGFRPGHLTVFAARTSRGKTALAIQAAINSAEAGHATAFFSLEMPADELWLRALGCVARVNMFRVGRWGYRDGEAADLQQAQRVLETVPLQILYRPGLQPRVLRLECRRLARELGPLKLVVVDYLGMMRGDRSERERWREMQEIVFRLKLLAGELNCSLLLLSQLNRDAKDGVQPSLANLRDTGSAEEHANNVLFLWWPNVSGGPSADDWEAVKLYFAKQRGGPPGIEVDLQFCKAYGRFECV